MNFLIILAYAVSLSMDAFAVAICKGLSLGKARNIDCLKVGLYFGIFQGLMPMLGFFLAGTFSTYIEDFDHWIAFVLLLFIGGKMIKESFSSDQECETCAKDGLSFKKMVVLAIATSIDALAVGIAFSLDGMKTFSDGPLLGIFSSCLVICTVTLVLSFFGVKLGRIFEAKLKSRAEMAGGIVLILLGTKILAEHLTGTSLFGI